jgi:NADPH2:quinone reductase
MKSKAILVPRHGGPDVLEYREIDVPPPGAGEVQIRQAAIGLNYIDTYFRSGLYPAPNGFPYVAGEEGAGTIIAVGADAGDFREGDRVAYPAAAGAYSEIRNIAATKLVKVPDGIALETAAAMMMKGMTAEYLLNRTYKVGPGTVLLFHAAAGGVGLIAGQWAKSLGATVVGTAGGPEKVALARKHGYDHVIDYNSEDFVSRVKELTDGKGVDVVYDSVGRDTFPMSLDCLKARGLWVSFGQSSGAIDPIKISILAQKGSLYATRPTIFSYIRDRKELDECANALFSVVQGNKVVINIHQRYPLAEAAKAHADLENRKTSGTTLLIP